MKPKDDNHRFGHFAIEDVMALFQILLIAGAGIMVFYNSIHLENKYHFSWGAVLAMLGSMLPVYLIILIQKYAQKKTGSTIVKADLLHYSSDFITTMSVAFSMVISHYTGIIWFDVICGAVIMLFILKSCLKGGVIAFNNLMARELQDGTREAIESELSNSSEIIYYKDLRTRCSGQMRFAQVDIILREGISLKEAHDIVHLLEDRIKKNVKNLDIIIHTEPLENKPQ